MSASVVGSRSASWASMSSLEDSANGAGCPGEAVLTIEELRLQLNSCFTCGVSWQEQHVSLDCAECGGYSLARPCPLCEGRCGGSPWKRDLAASHATGRAAWCPAPCSQRLSSPPATILPPPQTASASS